MDDRNHELVNMLTNQMGNVFNPIAQKLVETNRQSAETNRQVIAQLTRLCNFLGAPQTAAGEAPPVRQAIPTHRDIGEIEEETVYQGQAVTPHKNVVVDP